MSRAKAAPAIGVEDLVEAERERVQDAMSILAIARKAVDDDTNPDLVRTLMTVEALLDRAVDALDSVYVKAAVAVTVAEAGEVAA